MYANTDFLKLV